MSNVIQEYLVSLGFQVDKKSFADVRKQLNGLETAIKGFIEGFTKDPAIKKLGARMALAGKMAGKASKQLGKWAANALQGVVQFATKILEIGMKFLGPGGILLTGIIAGVTGAVAVITGLITVALGLFMTKMADADLAVKKLAISLYTTVSNARSLSTVMQAMGIESLEDLKFVNLIPEQRKQFMELRDLAASMSFGDRTEDGLKNIREMQYAFQKLQVSLSYLFGFIAGELGQILKGPLKSFTKGIEKIVGMIQKHGGEYASKIAKLLSMFILIFDILLKLSEVIFRILDGLNKLFGFTKIFKDVGRIAKDILTFVDEALDHVLGGKGKKGQYFDEKGALVVTSKERYQEDRQKIQEQSDAWGRKLWGPNYKPEGSKSGEKANITIAPNVSLSEKTQKFIANLIPNLKGNYTITSGIRHKFAHDDSPRGHGSGNKFDIGLTGKSDREAADYIKAARMTPGFAEILVEATTARVSRIMKLLKDEGISDPRVKPAPNVRREGENIDTRINPAQITVNVYSNDPKTAGQSVTEKLQDMFLTRATQGQIA